MIKASCSWISGVIAYMFIRPPAQGPLANSSARLALMFRSGNGTRIIELGDRTVTAILLLATLLFAWYLFATLYLVFRDDLMISMLTGQRRANYAYEDRIVELRSRIDKITARQLLNQESIEDRVAGLVARQAELEARQILVADISTRADRIGLPVAVRESASALPGIMTGSTTLPPGAIALPYADPTPRKPQPLPPEPMKPESAQPLAQPKAPQNGFDAPKMRGPMDAVVQEIERRSGRMEKAQIETLETFGTLAEGEINRSRRAVAALGLDPARFGKSAFTGTPLRRPAPLDELSLRNVGSEDANTAMGGPLLPPMPGKSSSEDFEYAISRAESAIEGARKARSVFNALPIGRPMGHQYELSSGFGTRVDPFTRGLAQHSGLDFRAPTGSPIRAAAAGRVIEAGSAGGYGRMVEIDHGYGLTTRYAHMSSIAVNEGDAIQKGAIIGYVGSTGRSTGPHLHYEVRIDEEATDPMRFVRAGGLLAQ